MASKTVTGRLVNLFSRAFPWGVRAATHRQIKQYRDSRGEKGDQFLGKDCFLLDVVGRKSGESRPVMLMLVRRDDDLIVAGSYAGNPKTPNWYLNLMAAGRAHAEVDGDRWEVAARQVDVDPEREACWRLLVDAYPDFDTYRQLTDRQIPVAVLSPAD